MVKIAKKGSRKEGLDRSGVAGTGLTVLAFGTDLFSVGFDQRLDSRERDNLIAKALHISAPVGLRDVQFAAMPATIVFIIDMEKPP